MTATAGRTVAVGDPVRIKGERMERVGLIRLIRNCAPEFAGCAVEP